jgi:L-alanine-DL-glutamate epimerase-like enolase superfamily enzyme
MKNTIRKITEKFQAEEKAEKTAMQAEIQNPATGDDRRNFLKKAALGGLALGGLMAAPIEDVMAHTTSRVNRYSNPSDLKITDMRVAVLQVTGRQPVIRIDTNQGIYGLGDVRDGGDERYALMLKSRLLGENPCNVEMLWKKIKQFGHHGRQGGGVCAVEMALWDLAGKAYGVPAWQLLGGRYRDKIRLYADTPGAKNPKEFAKTMDLRVKEQGFTWLKMDLGIHVVAEKPGTIVNSKIWSGDDGKMKGQYDTRDYMSYGSTLHPFTQVQITDKGLEGLAEYVETVRNAVGYEIPLSSDHFGHFDVNNSIRFAKKMEPYRLAWVEDMVPWMDTERWKVLTQAIETPTITGEDIFSLNGFKPLIDAHAVDMIHPDLGTSGGLLETKRIGDYAEENGVAMAMHQAGSPITFMANVHCAAATQNFLALEHHSVDDAWWEKLVKPTGKQPLITKGFAPVPLDAPGLGIELNDEVMKQHLHPTAKGYFEPTPEWNEKRSHDRLWS